jgi:hypothetical protein
MFVANRTAKGTTATAKATYGHPLPFSFFSAVFTFVYATSGYVLGADGFVNTVIAHG